MSRLWTTPGRLNLRRLADPKNLLAGYFLDFSPDASYPGPFDSEGIPLVDYGGRIGLQYNPWAIAHFALAFVEPAAASNTATKVELLLRVANWLVRKAVVSPRGAALWLYDFDYPPLLRAPWRSALAQSVGISVLLRALILTGDARYEAAARGAFQALITDVREGGGSVRDEHGALFFEETAPNGVYHILNGCITSLWGVYEYSVTMNDHLARALFEEGAEGLAICLGDYDTGWGSLYSLQHKKMGWRLRDVASPFYHQLHVNQLRVMAVLTHVPVFESLAARWDGYLAKPSCRLHMLAAKSLFKIVHY